MSKALDLKHSAIHDVRSNTNTVPENFDAPWLKRFFKAKFGLKVRVRSLSGKIQYIDIWIPGDPELKFPGWFGNLCLREIYKADWIGSSNWAGNVNPRSITMSRPQWQVILQRLIDDEPL